MSHLRPASHCCSGGAYWEGGSGGAGSVFSLGRFPNAGLRQYSLAGAKLAFVNAADKRQGNFTQRAGAHHACVVLAARGAMSHNMRCRMPWHAVIVISCTFILNLSSATKPMFGAPSPATCKQQGSSGL